ncbi:MAG TPA: ABC transporter permease [Candidatus Acidoferrum sp.]|nr:ABC transporter permease [Candidatus Acidoferrum sp.]
MKKLRALSRRAALDSELDEEVRFHIETKEREYVAEGMSPREAHEAAMRDFGRVQQTREECRDMRGTQWIDNFWQDLRYGTRTLFKDRRFAILAIFALALGIGASTVVFSVIYDGLLNPFPYKNASGLTIFQIHNADEGGVRGRGAFQFPEFLDYREQNHVFSDMVGDAYTSVLYATPTGTDQLDGSYVTTNTFPFLGVQPLLGRWLNDTDGKPGAPPVFVMSYRCWKERFGGDPKLLGSQLTLNGKSRTLVGIMPNRFRYFGSAVYFPLSLSRDTPDGVNEYNRPRYLVAEERLKPGVTFAAVAADIEVVAQRLAKVYPHDYPKRFTIHVDSLASDVVGDSKTTLYLLLAAVAMLLLIACSNVANLLLARATVREKEISIRASLGASRWRLVRQLLVESLALALVGGALGCVFAYAGIRVTAGIIPDMLPGEAVLELSGAVLLFALGITLATTIICGLAPALHSVRRDLNAGLAGTAKGADSSFRHGKLRAALVVVEVALSIVLLAGTGLMVRSLYALTHVDLGFDPKNVLALDLAFPEGRYTTVAEKKAFFSQAVGKIQALPGVVSAAETMAFPPYNSDRSDDITIPGKVHSENWPTLFDVCSEDYFKTLGLRLLRGRLLSASDVDSGRFVAVVNQTFAQKYLGANDPLGQKIKFNVFDQIAQTPHNAYFEVIGVVSDVRNAGFREPVQPDAYIPYTITAYEDRHLIVRTAVDPHSVLKSVREQIWSVDRGVAVADEDVLTNVIQQYTFAEPQFGLESLGSFAAIGLILAAMGVFSIMGYTVSLQTHDIGIRMALGAQRGNIFRMIVGQGLGLVVAGIAIGFGVSLAVTRLLARELFGVTSTDPLIFAMVVLVVLTVGALACFLPARRATRVDPLIALRHE